MSCYIHFYGACSARDTSSNNTLISHTLQGLNWLIQNMVEGGGGIFGGGWGQDLGHMPPCSLPPQYTPDH